MATILDLTMARMDAALALEHAGAGVFGYRLRALPALSEVGAAAMWIALIREAHGVAFARRSDGAWAESLSKLDALDLLLEQEIAAAVKQAERRAA